MKNSIWPIITLALCLYICSLFFKKKTLGEKKPSPFITNFLYFGPKPPRLAKATSLNKFPLRDCTKFPPPPTQSHGSLPDHLLPHSSFSVFPQWELEVRTLKIVHNNCTPFLSSTIQSPHLGRHIYVAVTIDCPPPASLYILYSRPVSRQSLYKHW